MLSQQNPSKNNEMFVCFAKFYRKKELNLSRRSVKKKKDVAKKISQLFPILNRKIRLFHERSDTNTKKTTERIIFSSRKRKTKIRNKSKLSLKREQIPKKKTNKQIK